ncbi:MAG: transposase DNA-binding-containing protein [Verrucomicrobiota bacterium]
MRLARRFSKLMRMMSNGIGESVPSACQDWANTKAAYRFFANENVSEEHILCRSVGRRWRPHNCRTDAPGKS